MPHIPDGPDSAPAGATKAESKKPSKKHALIPTLNIRTYKPDQRLVDAALSMEAFTSDHGVPYRPEPSGR